MTTSDIVAAANLSVGARKLLTPELGPSRFVNLLESHGLFKDAVQFLAHGLPIEIAVKWACACSRELLPPPLLDQSKEALESVEAWLDTPDDSARWRARRAADESRMSSPVDFVAMAIFLSGGSVTPPEAPVTAPPPFVASKMVAGSIQLAVLAQTPENAALRYRKTLQLSRDIARPARK